MYWKHSADDNCSCSCNYDHGDCIIENDRSHPDHDRFHSCRHKQLRHESCDKNGCHATVINIVTVTTTSSPPNPTDSLLIVATGGSFIGQYAQLMLAPRRIRTTVDLSQAPEFTVDSNGHPASTVKCTTAKYTQDQRSTILINFNKASDIALLGYAYFGVSSGRRFRGIDMCR